MTRRQFREVRYEGKGRRRSDHLIHIVMNMKCESHWSVKLVFVSLFLLRTSATSCYVHKTASLESLCLACELKGGEKNEETFFKRERERERREKKELWSKIICTIIVLIDAMNMNWEMKWEGQILDVETEMKLSSWEKRTGETTKVDWKTRKLTWFFLSLSLSLSPSLLAACIIIYREPDFFFVVCPRKRKWWI